MQIVVSGKTARFRPWHCPGSGNSGTKDSKQQYQKNRTEEIKIKCKQLADDASLFLKDKNDIKAASDVIMESIGMQRPWVHRHGKLPATVP